MRIFDAQATCDALPFDKLIPALRAMFAAGCDVPLRHVHRIEAPEGEGGEAVTSLIMPAWLSGRAYGVKIVNVAPGNAAQGLPGLHASYVLHDARTGRPLALIDGDQITARRTAAASALAASWLAKPEATHLLIVGAGRVARLLPEAYCAVRPIERVTVWARMQSAPKRWRESCAAKASMRALQPTCEARLAKQISSAVPRSPPSRSCWAAGCERAATSI